MFKGDYSRDAGYRLALEIIKTKPKVTAIFSANDIMAMGVLQALAEKGLKSPDDIALVGFDDIEMAGLELTQAGYNSAVGFQSEERLLDNLRDYAPAPIVDDTAFRPGWERDRSQVRLVGFRKHIQGHFDQFPTRFLQVHIGSADRNQFRVQYRHSLWFPGLHYPLYQDRP